MAAIVVGATVVLATFLILRGPADPPQGYSEGGSAGASVETSPNGGMGGAGEPPACVAAPGARTVGVRADGVGAVEPPSPSLDAGTDSDALLLPSGVVVGRACATEAGFAVGIKRDGPSGSLAEIVRMDRRGVAAPSVPAGAVRGDLDAPAVFADGDRLLVGLLEPDAAGYNLRIGLVEESAVRWGQELAQRRDESLAFDLAISGETIAVVWDESDRRGGRTRIALATLDRTSLAESRSGRHVSAETHDGELPRVVARPGGYWLAYVARGASKLAEKPSDAELQRDPEENRHSAELIEPSWIDIVPLDESGVPIGPARPATARDGHAQEFDLAVGADGTLVIAWQDEDTPTGALGGEIWATSVTMAGVEPPHIVADESQDLGGPRLLDTLLVAFGPQGEPWLGKLDGRGRVRAPLRPEPVLGSGQPLAVVGEDVLVARSVSGGVDLELARCRLPDASPSSATPSVAPAASASEAPSSSASAAPRPGS